MCDATPQDTGNITLSGMININVGFYSLAFDNASPVHFFILISHF